MERLAHLDKTEEVRRLGMGRLLGDLALKMQRKVDLRDQDPLKILLHTTHDTALAALCSTLDVFDEQ
jgi:acid phosphatase